MTGTRAHDIDEIRIAELELPDLSPEERELVADRVARYVRRVAAAPSLDELADALERIDGDDLDGLVALLDQVRARL